MCGRHLTKESFVWPFSTGQQQRTTPAIKINTRVIDPWLLFSYHCLYIVSIIVVLSPPSKPSLRRKARQDRIEYYSIDGELVGISNSKRKAVVMLGAEDGDGDRDVRTSTANKWSKSEDETGAGMESVGKGGGIGAIKNLISTLFRAGDKGGGNGKAVGENEAESGSGERGNNEIASKNESGRIIKSIVSHLPPSLPEDAALATDEATILIHSIIHD